MVAYMEKPTNFNDIALAAPILAKLAELGFTEPTSIQAEIIPLLLEHERQDVHGQAQTGTGKTLAFGLPLLHRIKSEEKGAQALIVAPTRELAVQITESIAPFAKAMGVSFATVYGGASITDQMRVLKRGVQIVVGTPGRLNDHLSRGTLKLDKLQTLILDEADIMLDLGFRDEIEEILGFMPKEREIWLFSATVKQGISDLMRKHMHDTVSVSVSREHVGSSSTKQYYCVMPMMHRLPALCRFVEAAPDFYGFVFCQTKVLTSEVAEQLVRRGYRVGALHGDLSQSQRNAVLKKFRDRDYAIVVATDVAGRGIDVQDLTHVINYSLPEDYESYVHRTGRTGRAGKEGIAITFVSNHQVRELKSIERKFMLTIQPIALPSREEIVQGRLVKAAEYLASLQADSVIDAKLQPALQGVTGQFDEKQMARIVEFLVYDKFLKSVVNEDRLDEVSSRGQGQSSHVSVEDPGFQELMFFVGSDDGITQDEVRDHILQNGSIAPDVITKIRMIKRRTFVHVPTELAEQIINALRDTSIGGRKMSARLVEPEANDRPQRRFGGGGFRRGGGERRGGFGGDRRGGQRRGGFGEYRSGEAGTTGESGGERRFGGERRGGFGGDRRGGGQRRERWADR